MFIQLYMHVQLFRALPELCCTAGFLQHRTMYVGVQGRAKTAVLGGNESFQETTKMVNYLAYLASSLAKVVLSCVFYIPSNQQTLIIGG